PPLVPSARVSPSRSPGRDRSTSACTAATPSMRTPSPHRRAGRGRWFAASPARRAIGSSLPGVVYSAGLSARGPAQGHRDNRLLPLPPRVRLGEPPSLLLGSATERQ